MAAYVFGTVDVTDPDQYGKYSQQAPGVFKKFGAKVRVRGGETAALEGPKPAGRNVMVEFADMDGLKAWYNSSDYKEIAKLREGAANTIAIALDGDPLDLADGDKPGYFVAKLTIHDEDKYGAYVAKAVPLVKAAGGEIFARGEIIKLEGDETFEQGLIIKFPSFAVARDFYHADGYQDIIPLRDGAADVQFFVVEGA